MKISHSPSGLGPILLNTVTIEQRFVMLTVSSANAFIMYQFLNANNAIKNSFRPWRTTRHINIYRNDLIDALQYTVSIKNAAGRSTGTYCHNPTWLRHLQINLS